MRACFLGQNITALGYGVATLQTPPLVVDEETGKPVEGRPDARSRTGDKSLSGRTELPAPKVGNGPL